jgi:hypothetical protein
MTSATFDAEDCAEILRIAAFTSSPQDERIRTALEATQVSSVRIVQSGDGAVAWEVPAGTARVHWACLPSLVSPSSAARYFDLAPGADFVPPVGFPAVDALAQDASGNPIGGWAGRILILQAGISTGLVLNADVTSPVTKRAVALGAHRIRVEFPIDSAPSAIQALQAAYPGVTVQPLAGFPGRIATRSEAAGLASWPGVVEFGNETNYQVPNTFVNGKLYGESAAAAIAAGARILVQGSDAGSGSGEWLSGVFAGLGAARPVGWTIHPYPGGVDAAATDGWGIPMMQRLVSGLESHGDFTTPIYATEWGVPTDNGRTLSDGKHYTFAEAALMTTQHVGALRTASRGRLAQLLVYCGHDLAATGTTTNREEFFGTLTLSGGPKGAYTTAVAALLTS